MADISNARPLAIFTGYMIAATVLTTTSIAVIHNGASKHTATQPVSSKLRLKIPVFSFLAAVSLATTWCHLFCFFRWSYEEWAKTHTLSDQGKLHLGEWLQDTALFQQAWGSGLKTAPRAWWSSQIFGFGANWSIMVAAQERKRKIPRLWFCVLLGHIVAVSFASNMFFLKVLVHDQVTLAEVDHGSQRPKSLLTRASSTAFWFDPIIFSIDLSFKVPSTIGQPNFMALLLFLHLLSFMPLFFNRLMPEQGPAHMLGKPSLKVKLGSTVVIVSWATLMVVDGRGDWSTIVEALHEHPAVTATGYDVVCCWVSHTAWHLFGDP